MSRKQEILSDAAFEAWSFSPDFNFACKNGWVTAAACKYYCLLVVNPTITNCCKEVHLKCGRAPNLSLKTLPCIKTSPVLYENQCFFLLFRNVATFFQNHCFSLLLFTAWWSIFDDPFKRLLSLSCFDGSNQWLFKVKFTCKRANFIK